MKSKSVHFSPTHSTEKLVKRISQGLGFENQCYDVSYLEDENLELSIEEEDLLIIGMPVYGGRIPKVAVDRIRNIKGNNTPAIIIVTYGNRDYDDALLELKNIVENQGFRTVGAGAIVTEHSIFNKIGEGRPDEEDYRLIDKFIKDIKDKLTSNQDIFKDIVVKGNENYREYTNIPLKPKCNPRICIECGVCSKSCPVGAIPQDALQVTNEDLCISCMRCIRDCPESARSLPTLKAMVAGEALKQKCKERKEPEFIY